MEIEVPLADSQWPPACPCCGGHADGMLELKQSRGVFLVVAAAETVVTLNIPYCLACVRHARAYEKGTFGRLLYPSAFVLAGAFFAGVITLAVTGGGTGSFEMLMLLHIPAAVTVLFIALRVILRIRARAESPHFSTAPVMRLKSWTDDAVLLECANTTYGSAFQDANGGARQFLRTGW